MAMPWGLSVVTLQGPSLAWRSASARRWRTESRVQASLRTMGECRASGSESETRAMGMPTAWAHDTSVTTKTALFTITDCSGYYRERWANPGTDRTDSEFPAKCAGNSCQSCQSPGVAERTQFPGFPFEENPLRRSPLRLGAAGGEPGGVPVPQGG